MDRDSSPSPPEMAESFRRFGRNETVHSCPLYSRLCETVAASPDLLRLVAAIRHPPYPNLFFAAIHDLLLQGAPHPLARFYPTVSGGTTPEEDPGPDLIDFCRRYEAELKTLFQSRRVQTNEIRRCTALLPGLALAAHELNRIPFHLIDLGSSAGLHLLWDRFSYDYDGHRVGPNSPVLLSCTLRGPRRPLLPEPLPTLSSRSGIDLHPVNLNDPNEVRWMKALLWPQSPERHQRLEAALSLAGTSPPSVRRGNALEILPTILGELPPLEPLLLQHSHVHAQLSGSQRRRLDELLEAESARRPVLRLGLEHDESDRSLLRLVSYHPARRDDRLLALAHPHGEWLEWLIDSRP